MYNSNYFSPFPLWRNNKVNCLEEFVYSNYPLCLFVISHQVERGKSREIKELRRTEREVDEGVGVGGVAGSDKASRKKASGRGEISKCVKSGGGMSGEENELRVGMKETGRITKTRNTLGFQFLLNCISSAEK